MTKSIQTEIIDRVGIVTLDRPEALNALNLEMQEQVCAAIEGFDADPNIGAIVLAGSEKAFAAGADIKEMADQSASQMFRANWFGGWDRLTRIRTPILCAVSGFALGGGCELAMMADIIFASETAKFGQPEIKLGVIPGMGGSQRLARAIGKAKAMDMILTGRMIGAEEAERSGLVARVLPADELMPAALEAAKTIASYSKPATMMAKEAVNRAYESSLAEGILFERRSFHALFATKDQKEGMQAFQDKRPAVFKGE